MSGLQLAGITIVVIVILALIGVGIYNIRRGLQILPEAERLGQESIWHRQPNILLGISNIAFAILIGLVALLGTNPGSVARNIIFTLMVLVFLFSAFLVIRTALSALRTVKNLREKQQTNKRL
jgi:quinol-cytochrome oxidoreductase complex cytochrome b subunit